MYWDILHIFKYIKTFELQNRDEMKSCVCVCRNCLFIVNKNFEGHLMNPLMKEKYMRKRKKNEAQQTDNEAKHLCIEIFKHLCSL